MKQFIAATMIALLGATAAVAAPRQASGQQTKQIRKADKQ